MLTCDVCCQNNQKLNNNLSAWWCMKSLHSLDFLFPLGLYDWLKQENVQTSTDSRSSAMKKRMSSHFRILYILFQVSFFRVQTMKVFCWWIKNWFMFHVFIFDYLLADLSVDCNIYFLLLIYYGSRQGERIICIKEPKAFKGTTKSTRKLKELSNVLEDKEYSHVLWWKQVHQLTGIFWVFNGLHIGILDFDWNYAIYLLFVDVFAAEDAVVQEAFYSPTN